jgi:hypothetical protein
VFELLYGATSLTLRTLDAEAPRFPEESTLTVDEADGTLHLARTPAEDNDVIAGTGGIDGGRRCGVRRPRRRADSAQDRVPSVAVHDQGRTDWVTFADVDELRRSNRPMRETASSKVHR